MTWPEGAPTENYAVVKRTNADARVWGNILIKQRQLGAITTGRCDSPPMNVGQWMWIFDTDVWILDTDTKFDFDIDFDMDLL